MDMAQLMEMLSKMDKKDLEKGIAQASEILKNNDKNNVSDDLKKKNNPR